MGMGMWTVLGSFVRMFDNSVSWIVFTLVKKIVTVDILIQLV